MTISATTDNLKIIIDIHQNIVYKLIVYLILLKRWLEWVLYSLYWQKKMFKQAMLCLEHCNFNVFRFHVYMTRLGYKLKFKMPVKFRVKWNISSFTGIRPLFFLYLRGLDNRAQLSTFLSRKWMVHHTVNFGFFSCLLLNKLSMYFLEVFYSAGKSWFIQQWVGPDPFPAPFV